MLLAQVAWVRRKAGGKAALPHAHLQADFDIVTPAGQGPADLLLAEAECIKAVLEVSMALLEQHSATCCVSAGLHWLMLLCSCGVA